MIVGAHVHPYYTYNESHDLSWLNHVKCDVEVPLKLNRGDVCSGSGITSSIFWGTSAFEMLESPTAYLKFKVPAGAALGATKGNVDVLEFSILVFPF